ncbi:MAG: family 43 glycosylhydrolase [Fibrobacter sp.]|nr:family 43 glycosylhydrolase [Fibrobacter sp.]
MNIRFGALLLTTVLTNAIAADWFAKESRWAGHDPDIIRYEDGYALATTDNHMLMQFSEDAYNWKNGEPAMPQFSQWLYDYAPNMIDIWAPDIHYVGEEYRMYYCGSEMGIRSSGMGFMSSKEIDPTKPGYGWTDQGEVIHTVKTDAYNAIDAAVLKDLDGKVWMAFGSWGTGIHILELDETTGKVKNGAKMQNIANRGGSGVEGASLIEHDGYYYLFTAWDNCCKKGADLENNSYKTTVGRSNRIDGGYVDRSGKALLNGGGTILLSRYGRYYGPAGGEAFQDVNRQRFVNHYYDKNDGGNSYIQVRDIVYTDDGWPELGQPFLGRYLSAEAEHGALTHVDISSSSDASNGEFVAYINYEDSKIRLPMIIPQAGEYLIRYRYDNNWTEDGANGSSHFVSINGKNQEVALPLTGAWSEFPEKSVVYIPTKLKRGSNFIEITKGKHYAELDRLDFLRIIRDSIPGNGFDNGIRVSLDADDQLNIKDGGYALFENVITDSIVGAGVKVELKECSGGTLSLRTESKKGEVISKCEVPSTCESSKWIEVQCANLPELAGVQDFFLTADGLGGALKVGNIRFGEAIDSSKTVVKPVAGEAAFRLTVRDRKVYLSSVTDWALLDLNGVVLRRGRGNEISLGSIATGSYLVRTKYKTSRITIR